MGKESPNITYRNSTNEEKRLLIYLKDTGLSSYQVKRTTNALLRESINLDSLMRMQQSEIRKIDGISPASAQKIFYYKVTGEKLD